MHISTHTAHRCHLLAYSTAKVLHFTDMATSEQVTRVGLSIWEDIVGVARQLLQPVVPTGCNNRLQSVYGPLLLTAYRNLPTPYPTVPSPTLYDVPFSHNTKRYGQTDDRRTEDRTISATVLQSTVD